MFADLATIVRILHQFSDYRLAFSFWNRIQRPKKREQLLLEDMIANRGAVTNDGSEKANRACCFCTDDLPST
jgi:hypothetical protein